jgi:hypothetical protein
MAQLKEARAEWRYEKLVRRIPSPRVIAKHSKCYRTTR